VRIRSVGWPVLILASSHLLAATVCGSEAWGPASTALTNDPDTAAAVNPPNKLEATLPRTRTSAPRPLAATADGIPLATAFVPTHPAAGTPAVLAVQTTVTTSHVVRKGETLASIARRYGVAIQDLIVWNGIPNPDLIWVGQELALRELPGTTPTLTDQALSHVVHKGETLALIARRYGESVENLVAWNDIRNTDLIWAGRMLVVGVPPTRATTATPVSTATPPVTPTPMPPPATKPIVAPTATEPLSVAEPPYVRQISAIGEDSDRNSEAFVALTARASHQPSLLADGNRRVQTAVALGALELDSKSLQSLSAPRRLGSVHRDLLEASRLLNEAANLVRSPLDRPGSSEI
jgi:LysM repeat protein